jgi:hypothetical protein
MIFESGEPRCNVIDRETGELRKMPVQVPLPLPQIPHGLTRVRTLATASKINWSMLFKEIIVVYYEIHTKHIYSMDKLHSC